MNGDSPYTDSFRQCFLSLIWFQESTSPAQLKSLQSACPQESDWRYCKNCRTLEDTVWSLYTLWRLLYWPSSNVYLWSLLRTTSKRSVFILFKNHKQRPLRAQQATVFVQWDEGKVYVDIWVEYWQSFMQHSLLEVLFAQSNHNHNVNDQNEILCKECEAPFTSHYFNQCCSRMNGPLITVVLIERRSCHHYHRPDSFSTRLLNKCNFCNFTVEKSTWMAMSVCQLVHHCVPDWNISITADELLCNMLQTFVVLGGWIWLTLVIP